MNFTGEIAELVHEVYGTWPLDVLWDQDKGFFVALFPALDGLEEVEVVLLDYRFLSWSLPYKAFVQAKNHLRRGRDVAILTSKAIFYVPQSFKENILLWARENIAHSFSVPVEELSFALPTRFFRSLHGTNRLFCKQGD